VTGRNRITDPLESFSVADIRPSDRIARNFVIAELTVSEIASRRGIDNSIVTDEQLRSAIYLARNVLQPVRDHYVPFSPNSVFRSQALERVLKRKPARWMSVSQHTRGEACDIEIPGIPTLELAKWCAANLPNFDQIICECFEPEKGKNSGWVHVSLVAPGGRPNRRKKTSMVRHPDTGLWVYVDGLRAESWLA